MKISWLQKNKWGLILVVPALVLALGASSFRLVIIYLPWSAEYGTHVEGEVVIPSERVGVELLGNQKFEAHLTMLSLTPVTSVADPNLGGLGFSDSGSSYTEVITERENS